MSRDEYTAPILFPDFSSRADYYSQRDYLTDVMVELAESGKLRVTDLYNQPEPIPDLCGGIILGHAFAEEGDGFRHDGAEIPEVLATYKVRIRTFAHVEETVEKFGGADTQAWTVKCKLPSKKYGVQHRDSEGKVRTVYKLKPQSYDSGETDVVVSIARAWRILRQHGAYCRRASGILRLQNALWKCEEVPLETETEAPKRGRGRPPKVRAEVTVDNDGQSASL